METVRATNQLGEVLNGISPLLLALIGVFSGAGVWSWLNKKLETRLEMRKLEKASEDRDRQTLADVSQELLRRISDMADTNTRLAVELAAAQSKLEEALHEIEVLKSILTRLDGERGGS